MRRTAVGNFTGANKAWLKTPVSPETLETYEENCIWAHEGEEPVQIREVIELINKMTE
jgi:hypothetical protein